MTKRKSRDRWPSGELVQAIPDYPPSELSINAVYETRRDLLAKLQAFLRFLRVRFGGSTGSE